MTEDNLYFASHPSNSIRVFSLYFAPHPNNSIRQFSLYFAPHPNNSIRQFEFYPVILGTAENSLCSLPHTGNGRR
jgi:hypothetical protein